MTEPVSNVEIEDVLSSIRRLVSENGRSDASVEASAPKAARPERLVLTPALRVAEPVEPTEEADTESEPEIEAVESEDSPAEFDFVHQSDWAEEADFDAESEAAAEVELGGTIEVEAEFEAEEPLDTELAADEVAEEVAEVLEEVAREEAELESLELPEPELVTDVIPSALSADLESRIAKWEAVVATAEGNYEPARAGEDDYAGTEVESLPWQDHSDPVTEYQGDIRHHEVAEVEAEDEADKAEEFEAEELVVEAVADDVTEQFQSGVDEALLDEDALRDLVGEIVRQELQGALGERITRNVRKLVRREIHRALSANGLD